MTKPRNIADRVSRILTMGLEDERIHLEFPGLCGNQRVSNPKGKCKHGHLSISVTDETVREVAFREGDDSYVMILITAPKSVWDESNE